MIGVQAGWNQKQEAGSVLHGARDGRNFLVQGMKEVFKCPNVTSGNFHYFSHFGEEN